jgi:hypothetical protein
MNTAFGGKIVYLSSVASRQSSVVSIDARCCATFQLAAAAEFALEYFGDLY